MRSVALLLLLTGCLAPRYNRPTAPVPDALPEQAQLAAWTTEGELDWRQTFRDPGLQRLIESALANNRDLRATALAVEEARVRLRLASSALGPAVGLEASYTHIGTPASVSPFGEAYTVTQARVGPTVSWEVDLFGRLRGERRSAALGVLASAEDVRAAELALIGQVATAALQERVLAEQSELARRTRDGRVEAADIVRLRVEAGVASELDLLQAQALVSSADASVASLERATEQAHNALVLLVGEDVPHQPRSGASLDGLVALHVPAGLPSELLVRRPDVRAAEQRLIAAHADIGAARAAYLPSISLTAAPATASSSLTGLFQPGTLAWNVAAPTLTLPIFRWGQLRANEKGAKVARERAVAAYEGSIQQAFREVADVLVALPTVDTELQARTELAETQAARHALASQQYEAGVTDYLSVLDAERDRFTAEQSAMDVRLQQALLAVDLYRVLGGSAVREGDGA